MSRLVIPKLAFLMHIPEMYYHYAPVLHRLPPDSFDIILPDEPDPALVQLLNAFNYPLALISELLSARTLYKYLVTDHLFLQDYHLLQNLGVHQIRLVSELGFDRLQLGNDNRFYDLILNFGRYQTQKLGFCRQTRFYSVGWPRLDRWFEGMDLDLPALLQQFNCDRYRPILLWMPTWGELSSIEAYANTLATLTDRYNLIVKPHDYTLLEEPERMQLLHQQRFQQVVTEPMDDLLLYAVADYVLADYGNTPFGALYTEQRLILLDLPDAFNHPLTGFGSSDVMLRNYFPSLDPKDNPDALVRLIEGPDRWKPTARYHRMRDRLFAPVYGRAAEETVRVLGAIEQFF